MHVDACTRHAARPRAPARVGRGPRLGVVALLPLLAHCAAAPKLDDVPAGHAIPPGNTTLLDRVIDAGLGDEPGVCAVRLIEPIRWPSAIARRPPPSAERSLDMQYYIWHDDLTGKLIAAEVLRAAERGVRVRILVDDIDARAKHELFEVADLHPNIEVRIFNPFYSRSGWFGQLTEVADPRPPPEPAHAQQGVDRRQPGRDRRRAQHRRRVFRRVRRMSNFADLDLVLAGPIVDRDQRVVRRVLEQPERRAGGPVRSRKPPPPEALQRSWSRTRRSTAARRGERPVHRRTARRADSAPRCSRRSRRRSRCGTWNCWSTIRRRSASKARRTGESREHWPGSSGHAEERSGRSLIVSAYFVPGRGGHPPDRRTEGARRARGRAHQFARCDRRRRRAHGLHALVATELLRGGCRAFEIKRNGGQRSGSAAVQRHGLLRCEPAHQGDDRRSTDGCTSGR